MHIGPAPNHEGSTDWADLAQQRLASQQKLQALANQIAAVHVWRNDRKNGVLRTQRASFHHRSRTRRHRS
jgi:hypothetical protein